MVKSQWLLYVTLIRLKTAISSLELMETDYYPGGKEKKTKEIVR